MSFLFHCGAIRVLCASMLAATAPACGHNGASPAATVPADARTTTLSIFGMDCEEDPPIVVAELRKESGVYDAQFDKKRVVVRVVANASVSPERLVAAVARTPFKAEISEKGGAWAPAPTFPPGADVDVSVKDGSDIANVDSLAVKGKVTVVDFYGDWCKPCRQVDEHMRSVLASQSDVAYRKLNIIDWDSALAKHYMAKVPELPYVIVYGKSGARIAAITGLHIDQLDAGIAKARAS